MTSHAPVVLDIAGTTLNSDDRRRLKHPLTGGLIFFARNWVNRQQLTELAAEDQVHPPRHFDQRRSRRRARAALSYRRFHAPAADARARRAVDARRAHGHRRRHRRWPGAGLRVARLWRVDLSFTPVLDLDHGGSSVIGDRAFHRDARVATVLAKSLMHGLLLSGMANCGKHFPGHGFVKADSHTEVPVDKRSLKVILADDAKPYEWLSTSLSSVMPAHIIYPKVDALPAGFSARWLKDILRQQLGFAGAIFSDDLSMEGAKVAGGQIDAARAALEAGCDMVLLCNQSLDGGQAVDALLDGLHDAIAQDHWQPDPDSEARRVKLLPQTAPLAWDELMHDAAYQRALERLP